jgi:hypothetical protein
MSARVSAIFPLGLPALCALLALGGCGDGEASYAIEDVRTTTDSGRPAPTENSEDLRFGTSAHPAVAGRDADAGPRRSQWSFQVPEGWAELPPAPMRDHGWRVGGEGGAECTLVVMGGGAGGLLANVNRWRKQMSLPPIEAAALAELPTKPWLGTDARLVSLAGTYVGMGGSVSVPNARLIGLVAPVESATAFLKLTGPAGVVAAEEKRFFALAASLRRVAEAPPPEPPREDAEPSESLSWTAPEGWTRQPPRPMRLVTFSPAAAPDVVVYVSVLGGRAGGLRANLERWYREMGLPAPSDAEVERLDRGPVLDGRGVYVELEGTFKGMGASEAPGSALLGMVLEREKGSVFVKMIGPAAAVKAEKARFRSFSESLRE